ncbi:MAG: complex I NDUFA9 subunit family protein [Pseudomonadota bacterium]
MVGKLAVVFGGSGFVGRNVVRELLKRDWRVRVAVRRPHQAQFLKPSGAVGQIQLAQANIRHEASVKDAIAGADAVVNCVGILFPTGPQNFDAIQADGAATIAQHAAKEGVQNFVHVSAIGADIDGEADYARTKAAGEAAVREAIPTASIVRPSIVFGSEDSFFNRFAEMSTLSPALPLVGGGNTRFQPVYVDDVADAICTCLENEDAAGKTYEIGGPTVYTFKELLQLMLKETGRSRVLVPIPSPVAPLVGLVGETAGMLPFLDPPITRDQIKLLNKDNVVDASRADGTLEELGVQPTAVEAILPDYMVRFRKYGQFSEREG